MLEVPNVIKQFEIDCLYCHDSGVVKLQRIKAKGLS
jgi:hypothetical protein